jgi:hypothetical protein
LRKKQHKNQSIIVDISQLRQEKGNSDQFLCFSLRHVYESRLERGGQRELEAVKTSTTRSHVEWDPKNEKAFLEDPQ